MPVDWTLIFKCLNAPFGARCFMTYEATDEAYIMTGS